MLLVFMHIAHTVLQVYPHAFRLMIGHVNITIKHEGIQITILDIVVAICPY